MFDVLATDVETVLNGARIPMKYRTHRDAARVLLSQIEHREYKCALSSDVYALARWANVSIGDHVADESFSEVMNIEASGHAMTYDLTVPEGSSYVINGMVCHNTTNLPETTTPNVVNDLCMRAWKTGCKGVTVYRVGSRKAVIVDEAASTTNGQPIFITECHAPKRPKELVCDVHRVSIKGAQYLVLVGLLNGEPYEIFAGLSQCVEVPRKTKFAIIIKNGKKDGVVTYNLRIPLADDDQLLLKDIVSLFDNPEHGALTRMISLSMRHGVPTQFLVEQLRRDKYSDLQSFSGVIARVLKGYIKDGTEVTDEKKCPECGGKLVYQAGCTGCTSCSWSRC